MFLRSSKTKHHKDKRSPSKSDRLQLQGHYQGGLKFRPKKLPIRKIKHSS